MFFVWSEICLIFWPSCCCCGRSGRLDHAPVSLFFAYACDLHMYINLLSASSSAFASSASLLRDCFELFCHHSCPLPPLGYLPNHSSPPIGSAKRCHNDLLFYLVVPPSPSPSSQAFPVSRRSCSRSCSRRVTWIC